jgi:threonine/homoserine/homoserine lactone efflux protein
MSLLALCLIHLVAVASPGPGFAVVFKHTVNYSLKNGLVTAVGIACGDLTLIFISVFGAGFLINKNPEILKWMQICGASYLTFLGFQALRAFFKFLIHGPTPETTLEKVVLANFQKSFFDGFLTTLGNPKAVVYFISISSQFMRSDQTNLDLFLLIFSMIAITLVWFSLVATIIGNKKVRPQFLKYRFYIDGIMGVVLSLFGIYFLLRL